MNLSETLPCRKKIGDIQGGVFLRGLDLTPWIVSWETKKLTEPKFNAAGTDVFFDDNGVVTHEVTYHFCVSLRSGLFAWIDREDIVTHLPNATLISG